MKFNRESMSFSDLISLLENKFQVHRVGFSDPESEEVMLKTMSSCALIARHNENPSIYAFNNLEGKDYLLSRGSSDRNTKVFSISDNEDTEISEHLSMLEQFRGLNLCEWYILKDYCAHIAQGDTYRVLSSYGLSDCIPEAQDNDTDVNVWVEYNYSEDYKDAIRAGYLMGDNSKHATFTDKQAAVDKIDSLINNRYTLEIGEQARPTYTVV